MNSQLRAVTKKVDDITVLADRLTSSLLLQRRTLVSMSVDITSLSSHISTDGAMALPRATDNTGGEWRSAHGWLRSWGRSSGASGHGEAGCPVGP